MDRRIVGAGERYADTDVLKQNLYAYIGLSKGLSAVLGTATLLNGLACTPTSPASLSVKVGAGEIYTLKNLDDNAYGSIAADTTHQIYKQGILLDAVTLSCPAPATSGFSVAYLVQVAFSEVDSEASSRQFEDPDTGEITTLTVNNTRQDRVNVTVKAGTAATTGTQTTPAPDAGFVGAYVVTVANGQTTIISDNISLYPGAPFITDKLQDKITQAQGDARYLQLSNYPNISFRASLTTNVLVPANTDPNSNGTIIKADNIIKNDGNCYNASTGLFTASVHGDYIFGFQYRVVDAISGGTYLTELIKNSTKLGFDEVINTLVGGTEIMSRTIPIELDVGDTVHVGEFNFTNTDCHVLGIAAPAFNANAFFGNLIRRLS